MNRRALAALGCAALAATLVAGCGEGGPRTSRVHGQVTLGGKPLDDGTVEFTATDGTHAAQGQIKAGAYDIPAAAGPVVDKPYKVSITSLVKTGKSRPSLMPGSEGPMEEFQNIIPSKYNSETTLTATVTDAKDQVDFTLEPGPAPKK